MEIGTVSMEMTKLTHCAKVSESYCKYLAKLMTSRIVSTTDKCLAPYYGGCDYTRVCLTSEFDVNCGNCLPGFATNPADIGGPCLSKRSYGGPLLQFWQFRLAVEFDSLLSVPHFYSLLADPS